ncbi:MAG: cytochrome c [Pseudomonadota bacterium]
MNRLWPCTRITAISAAFGTLFALTLTSATSYADGHRGDNDKAERAVQTRQSALKLMGFYMGPLGAMARGRVPVDLAVIENNAIRIASLAPMLKETFKSDTRGAEVETEALDVIWEQWDKFTTNADATEEKATALATLAAAGSEDGIRQAIGAVGKTCGGCHDDFREDDD